MAVKTYQYESETFNSETGEITQQRKLEIKTFDNEEDYIKVYKYLNTMFAFKNINQALVPTLIEISNYMSYADKGQEVILNMHVKEKIAKALNISVTRVNHNVVELRKADILRPVARGTYSVNPFVIGRGKWSDIKELRIAFDAVEDTMISQSVVQDRITSETMAQITQEVKFGSKRKNKGIEEKKEIKLGSDEKPKEIIDGSAIEVEEGKEAFTQLSLFDIYSEDAT